MFCGCGEKGGGNGRSWELQKRGGLAGNHQLSLFCSSHTFHSQGSVGQWPQGSSVVEQGHPRLEIYGRGVSGEAINEVDGRTGASMNGIDQQAWEDPLRLRSEGQWSHEMSSVSSVSSAGPPQGSIPADLPPGRALSLYQWSPQSSLPKGFILLTAEMSVSRGMGIWNLGY